MLEVLSSVTSSQIKPIEWLWRAPVKSLVAPQCLHPEMTASVSFRLTVTLQLPWLVSSRSYVGPVCQTLPGRAERVFSLLQVAFSDRQGLALQDYTENALMLQYNGH